MSHRDAHGAIVLVVFVDEVRRTWKNVINILLLFRILGDKKYHNIHVRVNYNKTQIYYEKIKQFQISLKMAIFKRLDSLLSLQIYYLRRLFLHRCVMVNTVSHIKCTSYGILFPNAVDKF